MLVQLFEYFIASYTFLKNIKMIGKKKMNMLTLVVRKSDLFYLENRGY